MYIKDCIFPLVSLVHTVCPVTSECVTHLFGNKNLTRTGIHFLSSSRSETLKKHIKSFFQHGNNIVQKIRILVHEILLFPLPNDVQQISKTKKRSSTPLLRGIALELFQNEVLIGRSYSESFCAETFSM